MLDYSQYFRSFYSKYINKKDGVLIYPNREVLRGRKFDKILLGNLIGKFSDLQDEFEKIRKLTKENGLIILTSINPLWGKLFGHSTPKTPLIYLWFIENLLEITGFEVIKKGYLTIPPSIPILSSLLNSFLPKIPKLKRLLPFQFIVAKPIKSSPSKNYSISVIIPMHNEADNIQDCLKLLPKMGRFTEIILVDDGSTDTTLKIAKSFQKKLKNLRVFSLNQNRGKVWAVKTGFDAARGDILMIWDADRSVPAQDLPRFYKLFATGSTQYAQGTRLAYPMEKQAMKFANLVGNLFFGWLYSWILNTRITDTLCGTKVIFKKDYQKIKFGTEPWGDFDLLFGAKKLGLNIKEIPVHYKARTAGLSKMKTFRYGLIVAKMSLKGIWEFKIKSFFRKNLLITCILLLAILVRFMGLIPNLPYHPDEGYIQKASNELFVSIISSGDFEPKAYKYGSIVFYLQALTYLPFLIGVYFLKTLSYITPISSFQNQTFIEAFQAVVFEFRERVFLVQRAGTAFFGVLSVVLIYIISKKLFSKPIGLISALIFAITPSHVRSSHWVTTDVLSLFTILFSLWCMINIFKTSQWKWYIWSGLTIGIASSIRYFPIAFLVYPLACLFDSKKNKQWLLKILTGIIFVILGFIISTPFLLFSKNSQEIFNYEMSNHVLPFYGTAVSAYATALGSFILSLGKNTLPEISTLNPSKFYPFYTRFLVFEGFGVIPTIMALLGAVITLFKFPKQFLFLFIIPFINWFYISFYMHAAYDRLVIPILPFLCIYIGVLFVFIWNLIKNKWPILISLTAVLTLLLSIVYYPLKESIYSSYDCSKPTVFKEAEIWIDNNLPLDAKVGHIPIFMFPSKPYSNLLEIQPYTIFYPEELREEGYEYIFINSSRFGYNLYPFYTDFFIRPEEMYQNTFIPLVLKSYKTQTEEKIIVSRARFCDPTELMIYKIPEYKELTPNQIVKFEFNNAQDFNKWRIQKFFELNKVSAQFNNKEGYKNLGSLEISWENIAYVGPRVYSEKIPITSNKLYSLTGWVKSSVNLTPIERDGFLRIDFYDEGQNISLPGESVILTKRFYGDSKWNKVSVKGKAPENAKFAIISAQVNGTKTSNSFYFDDLVLSSN